MLRIICGEISKLYRAIESIIKDIYPEAIPVPYLMSGGTDSRKYYNVCNNIYRFAAVMMSKEDNESVHSVNEKITVGNFKNMIRFFVEIMGRCNKITFVVSKLERTGLRTCSNCNHCMGIKFALWVRHRRVLRGVWTVLVSYIFFQ